MDSAYIVPWMPYAAGGLLPVEAINGELLLDGTITYVSRVTNGDDQLAFGFYNTEVAFVYYEMGSVHTKTSMEILVMLWVFLFLANTHIFYGRGVWQVHWLCAKSEKNIAVLMISQRHTGVSVCKISSWCSDIYS